MDSAIRSRWVMAGRVRTHYSETGDNGPPLVLLHGGTPGCSGEANFAPVLPPLGQHFRVIAPDSVGGFGLTDPTVPATEGVQSRVDHLEAFVEALCLNQVNLVGTIYAKWARFHLAGGGRYDSQFVVGSLDIAGQATLTINGTGKNRGTANQIFLVE